MISLNATTVNIFANWGGVFLSQGIGLAPSVSGNILLWESIAALFGAVIFGYVSYKWSAKFAGYIGQVILLIAVSILAFFIESLSVPILYVTFFAIGLVEMYVIASGFTILRIMATSKYVGTAFGFGNLVIWICGSSPVSQLWDVLVPANYVLKGFKAPLFFHVGLICLGFIKEKPITSLAEEN